MVVMNLKEIGRNCKKYRKSCGLLQVDVAQDTGYSTENISAFETGRNDNMRLLLWYFSKGMTYQDLIGGIHNG